MKTILVGHRFEPGDEALALMREAANVVVLKNESEALLLKEIESPLT